MAPAPPRTMKGTGAMAVSLTPALSPEYGSAVAKGLGIDIEEAVSSS